MINFTSDYIEGCHLSILNKINETNFEKTSGYGYDKYTAEAKRKILKFCECPTGDVFFFTGGTITNLVTIGALLKPYQAVIAVDSGHIAIHEAGAIELGGHKVIELKNHDGKLRVDDLIELINKYKEDENRMHMVMLGMVYLSQPTEIGTLYSKKELTEISKVCHENGLYLYIDGARLGYALATPSNDAFLPDLAKLCDAFYIGGTKCGTLLGEALVIPNPDLIPNFFTIMKQHGAIFAKGRLLGIQFDTLFTDNLYVDICKNAIEMAQIIKDDLIKKGYEFYIDSPTNQIFIIVSDLKLKELKGKLGFCFWEKLENKTAIRVSTSWATTKEDVDKLLSLF